MLESSQIKNRSLFPQSSSPADMAGKSTREATHHVASDAGRPCRTSQRNRQKQACDGIVAPQSPPCRPAGPWGACGRQSRGIARNGIGSHPGEAWTPCRSTACRDFAWMSPIPFRCASASALRPWIAKAVRQLHGFRILAAPLPSPSAQDTPDTGNPVPRR